MNSLAAEAISAQKLRGYEAPLSPVSLPGQYKIEQSSADGFVYITMDGAPWVAVGGGGGGGGSLNASYIIGSQINVTDGFGPVVFDSGVSAGGNAFLISSSAAPTLLAPFVAQQIDMSGVVPAGFALTGLDINMSVGVPGASVIQALVLTGASSTVAKAKGQALAVLNSRASKASSLQVVVRNKSATAGSIVGVSWDSTDFSGTPATASILNDVTHVLTLDGYTNVDAATNNVEFMGAVIRVPQSSNSNVRGVYVESYQTGGHGLQVSMTPLAASGAHGGVFSIGALAASYGVWVLHNGNTAGAATVALRIDGSAQAAGAEFASGASLAVSPANTGRLRYNSGTQTFQMSLNGAAYSDVATASGITLQTAYTAGNTIAVTAARPVGISAAAGVTSNLLALTNSTSASNGSLGVDYRRTAEPANGSTFTGNGVSILNQPMVTFTSTEASALLSLTHSPAPNGGTITDNTKLISGTTTAKSGFTAELSSTGVLTNTLTMLYLDASGATAGANTVNGVTVLLPASSSNSTTGFNCTGIMTAGRFFNGSLAASLSGTFVGCEIDCQTGVTSNNQAIIGGRFWVAATSNASAAGVSVLSNQTGSSCIVVAANGASGAPNGVKVTMATTIAKTGQDGSAFFAAIPGAAACGLAIYPTIDGAYGQNAIQVRREATITQSFTESAALIEFINTCTFSAGGQTFSQPQVNCGIFATVNGTASYTWSGKIIQAIQNVAQSSGTVSLTGRILSVEHTPTRSGGTHTDTTTGMAIVMTPAVSSAVVGQATVMQSNTSSSGCAANFVWNSAAGTNGVTGNGIVNIYTSVTGNSGTLTYLTIRALAASTLTASATITGCDLNLTSNITHGNFAIIGHSISVGASSSGSTRPILVSSTQTGAGSFGVEVELTPGSAASVGGIYVKMGANASGSAIAITQAGTGAGIAFLSADSGGAGHIQGPAGGSLLIKAGPRSGAGAGNSVEVYGSDGVTAGVGGSVFLTPGAGVGGSANGGVLIGSSLPCFAELYEMTAPAAGAANTARLFAQDNGAGKTQFCVQFSSGAVQVLATQP